LQRIEDAGQAPGEGDDGNLFAAARRNAEGPGGEHVGFGQLVVFAFTKHTHKIALFASVVAARLIHGFRARKIRHG